MTPYLLPSMAEIEATRPNGLRLVSTFSGCGGSCLGFRMAGYRTLWASEFVDAARETYAANHPGVPVDPRDIRLVTARDILDATGLAEGELDVFEGSPPCASFSTAGNRQADWGKTKSYSDRKQRTDDLFLEWLRLLEGLRPRAFVAENVAGLVVGAAKGFFLEILARMTAAGYRVRAKLLDAQWLGVPQVRRRTIFVGIREDLGVDPPFPTPFPERFSIRDACPWISNDVPDAEPFEEDADFSRLAIFKEWRKLAPGESSEKYLNLIRANAELPCPTVTATGGARGAAGVAHPSLPRKWSLRELRLLCGFPADFALPGRFPKAWERLGRSVPPPMMHAVAAALAAALGGR